MSSCIFCDIVLQNIHCDKVFENDIILAFRDNQPVASSHVLVIPKQHIISLLELEDIGTAKQLLLTVKNIAKLENIDKTGFRTVFNTKKDGGQTIPHLHMHIIGGRKMNWPPG